MRRSPFIEVIVRSFSQVQQGLPFSPPPCRSLSIRKCTGSGCAVRQRAEWPAEHCANEPFGFIGTALRTSVALCVALATLQGSAAVREVGPIELTVQDLNRELHFFTNILSFKPIAETKTDRGSADALLMMENTELRTAELQLGDERIRLTEHLTNKGRDIPPDSRSFDHWFQHIAIVVSDMDRAYERLRAHHVKYVSTAPQTLPAWNASAGGIKAFYFRDPEDHVLELIWFPPGKGDPKWQQPATKLFLGIDHTAIVVGDTDRSLAFYTNALGLRLAGQSENHGTEQEHLNQVFGARLRITALRAVHGPGIEFLEYITPPGGRSLPADTKASDLVFWRTHLLADDIENPALRRLSRSGSSGAFIVRDPDGHALQLSLANSP